MNDHELDEYAEQLVNQLIMCGLVSCAKYPSDNDAQRVDYKNYAKAAVVAFLTEHFLTK